MLKRIRLLSGIFLLSLFSTNTICQSIPTNGLIAWYQFSGNANDESGNGLNGAPIGLTSISDRHGNTGEAYYFPGYLSPNNSIIKLPPSDELDLLADFTLSLWVKPYEYNETNKVTDRGVGYISKNGSFGFGSLNCSDFNSWCNGVDLNKFQFHFYSPTAVDQVQYVGEDLGLIELNIWTHVAVTYNKNNKVIKFYKNGTLVKEQSNVSLNLPDSDQETLLAPYQLTGALDDVGFYNKALTDSEILQLFTATKKHQYISFSAIANKKYTDTPFNLPANASSGLPISYSSSNPSVATVSGNVVTITGVGTTIITANQAGNSIYSAAVEKTQTLTIEKGILTVTAENKSRTYGESNPSFTISYSGFKNSETSSVLDVLPTASTTATVNSNVGTYSIVPTGGSDNNYTFSYVNGSLTINKATLTATADSKSRVYGDTNPAFTITYTGFKNNETSSVIDTPPTASTTATVSSNVGSYNIVPAGGTDNNYSFSYVNGSLSITQATLTATADNKSRVYGDANPTFTITYSGFKNNESSSVIDTPPTASTTATVNSNVGSYNIVPAGGTDNNYSFSYVNGTLSITQATLTATADNKSRVYGDVNPAFTITYSGFKNSETSSVIDTPPTASTTATVSSNVGSYNIVSAGGTDNNYSFSYVNGSLSITQATLTATADNKSRVYGDANPTFTITYSGFKNNETSSVIDTPPTASTTATANSNVGSYNIVPSGGTDNNYSFSYVNGSLSITQATLTATADNKSRVYGDANPTFTITYSGFKNNETSSVIDTPPTASTTAILTSDVGTYSIIPSGGSDNNYTLTFVNGTLTIGKATLTATADNKTRVFGEANPTFTISYSGFKNNETSSVLDVLPTATTSATSASSTGTYAITLSGGSDNNYAFTLVNGTLTITKQLQTITFTTLSNKVETDGPFVLSASSSSGLPVTFSTTSTSKISISGNTVTILAPGSVTITASQTGNGDYEAATQVSQTICINPKKPTITASGLDSETLTLTSSSTAGNQWYRNTSIITGAANQSYTVNAEGQYSVKVTIDGCSGETSDAYAVIITDIEDPERGVKINVYPNPVHHNLNINLKGISENEQSSLTVFDASGKVISVLKVTGTSAQIDASKIPQGHYIIRVTNSKFIRTVKFIKN